MPRLKPGLLAGALAATLLCAAPASAECRWGGGRWQISSEGPWTLSLSVPAGQRCRRSFSYNGNVVLKRLNLVDQPSHGRVDLREGGYLVYAPAAGYQGGDRFRIEICGQTGGGGLSCTKLDYLVTVH